MAIHELLELLRSGFIYPPLQDLRSSPGPFRPWNFDGLRVEAIALQSPLLNQLFFVASQWV